MVFRNGKESGAENFIKAIQADLLQVKQPHFDIAFRLKEAKERGYAEAMGYEDIYCLSEAEFGFKFPSTKNDISVAAEYGKVRL